MSDGSQIQWTDATWNPTTGCTKVSPGCAHCYIERTPAFRIGHRKFDAKAHIPLVLHEDRLVAPLRWLKPRRVFVNSLSDLFHPDVPDAFIDQVFAVMALCPQHTFQILTKRAERMRRYVTERNEVGAFGQSVWAEMYRFRQSPPAVRWPLPNVWLGVSVENQHFADERIPLLLQTPAAVRFISAEPLLGPVTLAQFYNGGVTRDWLRGDTRLSWVIVGGESGPGARVCDVAWARGIATECRHAGVPLFVKQLGARVQIASSPLDEWPGSMRLLSGPNGGMGRVIGLHDKKGGDMAEWPEDLRIRQFPASWSTTPARSSKESASNHLTPALTDGIYRSAANGRPRGCREDGDDDERRGPLRS